jgi:DinB family protein
MTDRTARPEIARIDASRARLQELARKPSVGLTQAEPSTGERWEAGQVWGHIAEFPPYWVTQLTSIFASRAETPPFGRTVTDPARLGAIDQGLREPRAALVGRAMDGIDAVRTYLDGLGEADWSRSGRHAVRGVMSVTQIVDRFVVSHLEEHADQLESLAKAETGEVSTEAKRGAPSGGA